MDQPTPRPSRSPPQLAAQTIATVAVCVGLGAGVSTLSGIYAHPEWAIMSAALSFLAGVIFFAKSLQFWRERLDWRIWAIVISVLLSIILTFFALSFDSLRNTSVFWGSVFSSWVGAVAFFVVFGAVVTGFSVARPEEDSFDLRARILFRRQRGPHIDYIVERIRQQFEQFSESSVHEFRVDAYDAASDRLFISVINKTTVRNYITDTTNTYRSRVKYEALTPAPQGAENNHLMYVRVNDSALTEPISVIDAINFEFETMISHDDLCRIAYEMKHWVQAASEENEHQPARYTQRFSLFIENNLQNGREIAARIKGIGGKDFVEYRVKPGQRISLGSWKDLRPQIPIFCLKLALAP